ncbi:uncharacterized protein LY89DRAFT_783392 [Mollisia scopiformis]|uniref:Uncharacterized protein n=1 Tax=Mollisia scopiformis TaxID=149040 RepID=A0A194X545_MOLSC|nr:uncharacterized protein LY89DRAFT_783392 [Mollisia scopiformis]KUJ15194.1 hypothetical protein LY89DRAFT_783392 [Mollisia scopiformis]
MSMLVLIANGTEGIALDATYCTIGSGSSELYSDDNFSTILNIDTVFGKLSFGMAKFIDLTWDIGFSRCGQAMLAWIAYRVHTAALFRIMETQSVSYELFISLSLSLPSLVCLGSTTKSLFAKLGFRNRLALFWIVLSIIWVALWPTITNAMTGYVAESNTLVKLKTGEGYVDISNITSPSNLAFQVNYLNRTLVSIVLETGPNITLWNYFNQIYRAEDFYEPIYYQDVVAYPVYIFQNQSYNPQMWFNIPENVQCVATGVYQWGFSSSIVFAFTIINFLWFLGTYAVWTLMNRKSELCRKGRRLGQYRAMLDVVECIQEDLGMNICAYSEQELQEELKKKGGIKYYVEYGGDDSSHIGITSAKDKDPLRPRFGETYGQLRIRKSRNLET